MTTHDTIEILAHHEREYHKALGILRKTGSDLAWQMVRRECQQCLTWVAVLIRKMSERKAVA